MIKCDDVYEASSTTPPQHLETQAPSWNLILQEWQHWGVAARGCRKTHAALSQMFDASETKGNFSRITSISSHPPTSHRPRLCLPLLLVDLPGTPALGCAEDSNEKWPPTQRISSWAVTSSCLPFLLLP